MANMDISIPHQLSEEEALNRIKGLLGKLKDEQKDMVKDVNEEWTGKTGHFSFSAKGFNFSGMINVRPSSVDINAQIPFAVSLFSGTISKIIREKAAELLTENNTQLTTSNN